MGSAHGRRVPWVAGRHGGAPMAGTGGHADGRLRRLPRSTPWAAAAWGADSAAVVPMGGGFGAEDSAAAGWTAMAAAWRRRPPLVGWQGGTSVTRGTTRDVDSMPEVAAAGQDHGHPVLVAGVDGLVVAF